MDAIRIARGATGRDTILKILGSYHGHHDAVMVSVGVNLDWDETETDEIPSLRVRRRAPAGRGRPDSRRAVQRCRGASRRLDRLEEEGRLPACLIMEPAMMNIGVVFPEPGYLEAVREETARRGTPHLRRGQDRADGRARGATERFGVQPDLVTLAKTLGGGLPSGPSVARDEAMAVVEAGRVHQVGTFNGNPLRWQPRGPLWTRC